MTVWQKLSDQVKSKVGRYYKVLIPFMSVFLGLSLIGRDTDIIWASVKSEPRKFFKAKIYNLSRFLQTIATASDEELQKDNFRELVETFPLMLYHIALTGEKCYIAKIENQPFDIWIAPERLVRLNGKTVEIVQGWHIQTKRLYQYPVRRLTPEEWVEFVGVTFRNKIADVDFGFNGHIHFYNCLPLTEPISTERLRSLFKKLPLSYNKFVDSVSISTELKSTSGDSTIATWFIYPIVTEFVGVLDPDFAKVKEIYGQENITTISLVALKEKVVLGMVRQRMHTASSNP